MSGDLFDKILNYPQDGMNKDIVKELQGILATVAEPMKS